MKILTLTYEYPPLGGGGGKVALGLAEGLVKKGHQVDVFTMGFEDLPEHEQPVDKLNIFRLPSFRKKTESCHIGEMLPHEIKLYFRLLQEVKDKKYDIIHAHFIFPDGLVARLLGKKLGLPVLVTAHGSDVPGYNPDRFQFQHKLLAPIWHYVVKGIDCIASPSSHLVNLIENTRPSAITEVIPNGYTPERFVADKPKKNQVLVVTRMFPRKGVQYVIEAVSMLDKPIDLHIVGDGPYLEDLKNVAVDFKVDAKFWGWLDNDSEELKSLYESSSIFAFTSDQENFPINLLEAMCAGNAIITTNSSGTKEVVGAEAILVPPQSPKSICDALQQFIDDPSEAEAMGQRARHRLDTYFSWDNVTGQYECLMQRLLDEK